MKRKIVIGVILLLTIGIILVLIIRNTGRPQHTTLFPTIPEDTQPAITIPPSEPQSDHHMSPWPDSPPRSKTISNPSGTHSAYIAPLEWEIVGNLYIRNNETGEVKRLTNYLQSRSYKPKALAWFDDTLLLLIEGYSWGTCSVGGPLYLVNIRSGQFHDVLKPPLHQEVAEVSKYGNNIILRIASWDDNYMKCDLSTKVLSADSIIRSLRDN